MKKVILLLCLFLCPLGFSQIVYQWTPNVDPNWTASSSNFTWSSSCNVLTTNCTGNYSSNIHSYYQSPVINTSGCNSSQVTVSFIVNGTAECWYDYLYIEYSTNNGSTWNWLWLTNCSNQISWIGDVVFTNALLSHVVPVSSQFIYRIGFYSDGSVQRSEYKVTDFKVECLVVLGADVEFKGYQKQDQINFLEWFSKNEYDFKLLNSSDGVTWSILNVQTFSDKGEYHFEHKTNYSQNYYKLIAIDENGNEKELEKILFIENTPKVFVRYYNIIGQEVPADTKGILIVIDVEGNKYKIYK